MLISAPNHHLVNYMQMQGNSSRQEYAAVGDVVNMSARLMGNAARNTVLCDESTVKEAEDVLSFKQAMRIKVRGTPY